MVEYDSYHRPVTNLRISITSSCNLSCMYCHREGERLESDPHYTGKKSISFDDVKALIEIAPELGIRSLKFTGGEPLLRSGFIDMVRLVPPTIECSVTTNGILLPKLANDLYNAGLSRVNISVDSLNRENYVRITGRDLLDSALEGIEAALAANLTPVKLNFVLLKGYNEDEVDDFISFVAQHRAKGQLLILQIIELMNFTNIPYHANVTALEERIAQGATKVIQRRMHGRKKYLYHGAEIEFVRPVHNTHFCASCTRLRVTSDGKLKPCLLRTDNLVSIDGARGDALLEKIKEATCRRAPFYS
ncbi:MAG: GTP 3',8-cyclase MoaA [Methanomicrobiales archaeon]|nr:GTP 3',8-cyclase MoaA [Methanomicrobiales archaeon]